MCQVVSSLSTVGRLAGKHFNSAMLTSSILVFLYKDVLIVSYVA